MEILSKILAGIFTIFWVAVLIAIFAIVMSLLKDSEGVERSVSRPEKLLRKAGSKMTAKVADVMKVHDMQADEASTEKNHEEKYDETYDPFSGKHEKNKQNPFES